MPAALTARYSELALKDFDVFCETFASNVASQHRRSFDRKKSTCTGCVMGKRPDGAARSLRLT